MTIKNFIFKILVIISATLSLNLLIRVLINEPAWGNKNLYVKKDLFEKDSTINTIFIGSSLSQSAIDPVIIDSICTKLNLSSFNLAVHGCMPPETFYLCSNIIKTQPNVKNVFIELIPLKNSLSGEIITENFYFFNIGNYIFYNIYNYYQTNHFKSFKVAISNFYYSVKYSIYNVSNIGFLSNIALFNTKSSYNELKKTTLKNLTNKGFRPRKISKKDSISTTNDDMVFISDGYNRIAKKNNSSLNKSQLHYLKLIKEINQTCSEKNIKITWILPPCLNPSAYSYVFPVFKLVDVPDKINMADPEKYPYFYNTENHIDKSHFNNFGAIKYSIDLANEFINIKNH